MKTLSTITRGDHDFEVSAEHIFPATVRIKVSCIGAQLIGHMNHQGPHDYTVEQFERDVNAFAQRLVDELAGKLRSQELAEKFTSG